MTTKLLRTLICILIATSLITACGKDERMQELQKYVAQLKQTVEDKSKSQPPTVFSLPKPVTYGNAVANTAESVVANSKNTPLQRYPIRSLQFVGTISNNHKIAAYIMTPDNMIYQAKVGDVIGDSYGKITKIETDHIEILEQNTGTTASHNSPDHIVTMLLKE